jgi:hypothetical protein
MLKETEELYHQSCRLSRFMTTHLIKIWTGNGGRAAASVSAGFEEKSLAAPRMTMQSLAG